MLVKQKLKYIQSLGQKKFRDQENMFIAEGPKLVKDLLLADPASIREIYATADWAAENAGIIDEKRLTPITAEQLETISHLTTPNKVLAVVKQYEVKLPVKAQNQITLVLDRIQDPGNFGTIIRIADWFGLAQVVASHDSADVYNPKVVQSTMGSIARVKVYYENLFAWLNDQKNIRIYAADLNGEDVSKMEKISEGIIIIGNESKGVSEDLLQLASVKITIPRKGNAESLNAAVATGIILSQIL